LWLVGFIRSTVKGREDAPRQGLEGAPDAWLEIDGGNKINERRSTLIGRRESHLNAGYGHAALADGGGTTFD
jgi:hypothetical protein